MKRIGLIIFAMAMLLMPTIWSADGATPEIGIKADVGVFSSPGLRGSLLYSVEVYGAPFGINNKSIEVKTKDTTYTLNVYTSGAVYKSNSGYDSQEKMEAVRISTFVRKTLSLEWLYLDFGASGWNFFDVDDFGDDKTYSGILAGIAIDVHGLKVNVYGHNIVIIDEPDLYAATAGLTYSF